LVVHEPTSRTVQEEYAADPALVVWCLTPVEVWSGVYRKRREGVLGTPMIREARQRLDRLALDWLEIDDVRAVATRARRLLETHALRAADALQLAAALVSVRDQPGGVSFVTLDQRLADAAEKEGFEVVGVTPP
jgi:predicted nucleic acid-binding protein